MAYKLSKKSLSKLEGVHDDLVRVVKRAIEITVVDFAVLDGLRAPERQKTLKEYGLLPTVGAMRVFLFGGAVLGIAWRLPDLLAVLK